MMNTPENSDPEAKIETLTSAELRELLLTIETSGTPEGQDDRLFPPTPKPATYYDAPSAGNESAGGG